MLIAQNEKPEKVRARHHTWDNMNTAENTFTSCVTLDPADVMSSWKSLSVDTRAADFAAWPEVLHRAFVRTLSVRKRA